MSFTDKVVLVTGASRGIGRAIAETFAARGAKVVGTATSESGAEAISAYLGEQGCGMALNVTSQESIEAVFAAIKARFGDIDILINNAGITRDNLLMRMKDDEWNEIIDTNLTVNYAAAKAGLVGFTKSLAREVASRGITVNAVAPGFIETDMTKALNEEQRAGIMSQVPAARLGDPKEIAAAVVFLASDDAAYITGETLHVNGGMYMV